MKQIRYGVVDGCWMIAVVVLGAMMTLILGA